MAFCLAALAWPCKRTKFGMFVAWFGEVMMSVSSWWFFTNPFDTYATVKMGETLPQGSGVKIKNISNHQPGLND